MATQKKRIPNQQKATYYFFFSKMSLKYKSAENIQEQKL